ncbi:hypothetical protein EQM13_12805 [Acidilutibacter cellobiosedens]|jgi:hypothetical protein|uniref:Uncharacterized protein n=1 Tax=Acidilutibacter cellobiosedens TaxID=2507161 RepID=A0A410QEV8_9FIRM|nr:hypothetical protein [Acidilutibacter cellobiosedens]QAT62378.1 hypothetical protein EQM13_12805 [Acidilutibacter cellobiosedens]
MEPIYNPNASIHSKAGTQNISDNPTIMKDEEFGLGIMSHVPDPGGGGGGGNDDGGGSGGGGSLCGIIVLCCSGDGGSASLIEEDIIL